MSEVSSQTPLSILAEAIASCFDMTELKQLCWMLGKDPETFDTKRKPDFIREMVQFFYRGGGMDRLRGKLEEVRPNIDWQPLFEAIGDFVPTDKKGETSPYMGLRYFDEKDAHLYFGREQLVKELLARLPNPQDTRPTTQPKSNFLPIIGASGSGKSSLVRAGLLPKLRERGWEIRVIVPTEYPLKALAVAFEADFEQQLKKIKLLHSDESVLDLILQPYHAANKPTLLVVDQFEELFTTLPKIVDQNSESEQQRLADAKAEREQFVANLMYAVQQTARSGKTVLIITLRADFLHHCADYPDLWKALENQPKLLPVMTRAELASAIEKPAANNGDRLADGLVDTILRDCHVVADADRPEAGILPLLSHALERMWEESGGRMLTLNAYEQAGRVQGAIAKTAEEVYNNLNEEEQNQTRRIFLQLTELGEGSEDTRRRVPIDQLRIPAQTGKRSLLTHLADKRLITLDETHVDVTHEALIREWGRLRGWLANNREALRLQRRIAADAKEWQAHDRRADFLYRGVPLDRAIEWLTARKADATDEEQAFVTAGELERDHQAALAEAARRRELDAANQIASANQEVAEKAEALAKAQANIAGAAKRQAQRTRRWLALAVALLSIAVVLGIFANAARLSANNAQATSDYDKQRAESEATSAAISLVTAEAAEALAENNAAAASRAEQTAEARRLDAESSEALAEARRIEAEEERKETERLAKISLAQSLAALAPNIASDRFINDDELATLLAIESTRLNIEQLGSVTWLTDDALRRILTASYNNQTLTGHESIVLSVAFSPDGQTLASASSGPFGEGGTVRLWDLNQPDASPVVFTGHEDLVLSVAFSPDGQTLASASSDRTVRLWLPTLEQLVEIGCQQVRRNLSWAEWQRYLPTEAVYNRTCPNLPIHPSVPEEAWPQGAG